MANASPYPVAESRHFHVKLTADEARAICSALNRGTLYNLASEAYHLARELDKQYDRSRLMVALADQLVAWLATQELSPSGD